MENNINTDNNTRQQEETVQISQRSRRCPVKDGTGSP